MNAFIEIDDVLINKDIVDTYFTCDLEKCKGACCTMESDMGAPINEEEIPQIEKILPIVRKSLPGQSIKKIDSEGFWEKRQDLFLIKSINSKDCVFVYYSEGIARCAIEKAFFEKKINYRKPISCHLFPIRINNFGGSVLKYESYYQCDAALENGLLTKIRIAEFCKEALIRAYGKEWFEKLEKYFRSI